MNSKRMRLAAAAVLAALMLCCLSGCVEIGERKPIATILFSNGGEVRVRLYPEKAPNTVNNFIKLANDGFYDGSPVHRIVEYVMVQMGRPADSEETDAGYYIKGEFSANKFSKNNLTIDEGVLGMARLSADENEDARFFDTASSQFFIMLEPKATMDGYYATFGKVITGMNVITAISKMDVDESDYPRDEISIVSIRVDCYDYKPADPKTIDKDKLKLYE